MTSPPSSPPILILCRVSQPLARHAPGDAFSLTVPGAASYRGVGPVNTQVMKDSVLDLRRRGKTILFSTHIMEQAEKLCEQLCIIARGRKLVDGALSDIKPLHGGHYLVIGFDGSAGAAQQVFADRRLVKKVDDYGQFAGLELAAGADAQVILQRLLASGARLSRFELMEPSLNKIFIYLVGPEAARAAMRPEGEAARA